MAQAFPDWSHGVEVIEVTDAAAPWCESAHGPVSRLHEALWCRVLVECGLPMTPAGPPLSTRRHLPLTGRESRKRRPAKARGLSPPGPGCSGLRVRISKSACVSKVSGVLEEYKEICAL